MKMWGKIWKNNHIIRDTVAEDDTLDTRTHHVFHTLEQICYTFDLSKPIWFDATIREFQRHHRCRFYPDSFIDEVNFDYLEIQIMEE